MVTLFIIVTQNRNKNYHNYVILAKQDATNIVFYQITFRKLINPISIVSSLQLFDSRTKQEL